MKFSPLKKYFSSADQVLVADPDRLDEILLHHLKTYEGGGTVHQPVGGFNRDSYIRVMEGNARGLGPLPTQPEYGDRQPQVSSRMREAWNSVVLKGYLMQNPDQPVPDSFVITSAGEDLIKRFKQGAIPNDTVTRMLPRQSLHPKLRDKPWQDFMRGEFDTAVLQAMKAVEVSVRDAGNFGNNMVGVALMRQAFAVDTGPLTDTSVERGEQSARMDLFAGAIGSYKNPHSHRNVHLSDSMEGIEIILLANHLLRIVDARVTAKGTGK